MTLIKIVPFEIHHEISEAKIESMMDLLKDEVSESYDKDEAQRYLRSIAIREIMTPIVEMNIEFDWEEVSE